MNADYLMMLRGCTRLKVVKSIAALVCAANAMTAAAADFGLAADVGIGHTDNIEQSGADSPTSFGLARVAARLLSNTRTLSADIEASLTRYELSESAYEDYNRFAGTVDVTWTPLPERLSWYFGARAGQANADPTNSISYRSSGNAKVVETGPTFEQPLGGNNYLIAVGNYIHSGFGFGYDLDSSTTRGDLQFLHRISQNRNWGFGVRYRDSTEELGSLSGSFTVSTAYAGIQSVARRAALTAEISANQLKSSSEKSSLIGYSVFLEESYGSRGKLYASADRGWRDSADLFSATIDQLAEVGGTRYGPVTGEIFRYRQFRLGTFWGGRRADINLSASRSEELGTVRTDATLTMLFPLAARDELQLVLNGARQRQTLTQNSIHSRDWSVSGRYTWLFSERLRMLLDVTRVSGDDQSRPAFDEIRYSLAFRYGFGKSNEPTPVRFNRVNERRMDQIRGTQETQR